jgi:hypothetical protein
MIKLISLRRISDMNYQINDGSLYGLIIKNLQMNPDPRQTRAAITLLTCLAKNYPIIAYVRPETFKNTQGVKINMFEILHPGM